MSDSNRIGLAYGKEVSYAGALAAAKLKDLNYANETLEATVAAANSAHVRSDRQNPDVIRTDFKAGGQIAGELHYGGYDEFILGALMAASFSAEVAVITASTDVAVASGIFELGAGSWTNTPAAATWIEVRGFATAGNNGYFKVAASDSDSITPENAGTLVNEAATPAVTIKRAGQAVQGTTFSHFKIERTYGDLSNEFAVFDGQTVSRMGLKIGVRSIIGVEFDFLGKSEVSGSATVGDGSNTAASSAQSMNAIDHVPLILAGGSGVNVLDWNLDIDNKLREQPIVGTLGPNSLGAGALDLKGSLKLYYASKTLADQFLNFSATSLAIVTEDSAGNAYIWDIPEIRFSKGARMSKGRDTDCLLELEWMAKMDATEGNTVRVAKIAA